MAKDKDKIQEESKENLSEGGEGDAFARYEINKDIALPPIEGKDGGGDKPSSPKEKESRAKLIKIRGKVGKEQSSPAKLIKISGKIAKKGVASFIRCKIKFTDIPQELEVSEEILTKLKAEPMLKIEVIK